MFDNKKIVIFDLDGTLIDSIEIWNKIDVELVRRISGKSISFDEIKPIRDYVMENIREGEDKYLKYFEALASKYNSSLSATQISELNDEIALDMLRNHIDYKKDVEKLIKYLKKNNYILIIATTSPRYMVDIFVYENINIMKKANIREYFSKIYTKESVSIVKPNPEVYLNILKDLKVNPEDCISIEDSLEGVKASIGAGIEVIAIYDKFSDNNREEINNISTYQYDTFLDILKDVEVSNIYEKK